MENAEAVLARIQELPAVYGLRVIAALAILFFGRIAATSIRRIVVKMMTAGQVDPMIAVSQLADNSVNLVMRLWTNTRVCWGVYFRTTAAVKLRMDEAGIGIPFSQRDIHLYEHKVA